MNMPNPRHRFVKPSPEIIKVASSAGDRPKVKSKITVPIPRSISNEPNVQQGRAGQPLGAGLYKKPKPAVMKHTPKKYITEKKSDELEASASLKFPKIVNVSILAIVLILILFVFNQFTSLFVLLSQAPGWYQYIGYFFLALFFLLLIYSLISFIGIVIKLNSFDQQSLSELSGRRLTIKSVESRQETKDKLKSFTNGFDVNTSCFTESESESLIRAREQLLYSEYGGSLEWIEAYKISFQDILDQKADEIVNNYAKKVGWNTAIIPNGLLDSIVVFYMNLEMVKSLSVLYNIRIGRWSSLKLFAKIFIHTFGARQLEEMTEEMLQQASDHIFQGVSNLVMGKLGAKVSEGLINYYFTRRIGKKCIEYLQPLTK